jgi:predicted transcriptional regulator of viral defense system
LYVAVNLAEQQPVVSKFYIAGKITTSAYVSHHAAFEYYGYANQISYQVEVSSETPFISFEFDGLTFIYIASRISEGVTIQHGGTRITDIERTVIDGINDIKMSAGLEELLHCIELIPSLSEYKLLSYLAAYDKQVLYQKTGYLLRHFQKAFNLSEEFFKKCSENIGKSTRYLTKKGSGIYHNEWRLIAPSDLDLITNKGVNYSAVL